MKKFLVLLCLLISPVAYGRDPYIKFEIDAEKNAAMHNNLGLIHVQDRYYAAAIKEFNTAILLNPDKQATAVYYSNLANVYMKIGYPALAEDTLQRAIKLYPMNFSYYQDLVVAFKRQNLLSLKLKKYSRDTKNPLSSIMVGLILIEQGKTEAGMSKLQEFCYLEPDLIITHGVQKYINESTKTKL